MNIQIKSAGSHPDPTRPVQFRLRPYVEERDPDKMVVEKKWLTDLEMEVLFLIMDGYTDETIIELLMESPSVIHATHYVAGNDEYEYIAKENFPEVKFIKREQTEDSNFAWLG